MWWYNVHSIALRRLFREQYGLLLAETHLCPTAFADHRILLEAGSAYSGSALAVRGFIWAFLLCGINVGQTPFVRGFVRTSYAVWVCIHAITLHVNKSAMSWNIRNHPSSQHRHAIKQPRIWRTLLQQIRQTSHESCRNCILSMMKILLAEAANPKQQQTSKHKHGILGHLLSQKIPKQHLYSVDPAKISSLYMQWCFHRFYDISWILVHLPLLISSTWSTDARITTVNRIRTARTKHCWKYI